jgi:hypothetical protein
LTPHERGKPIAQFSLTVTVTVQPVDAAYRTGPPVSITPAKARRIAVEAVSQTLLYHDRPFSGLKHRQDNAITVKIERVK